MLRVGDGTKSAETLLALSEINPKLGHEISIMENLTTHSAPIGIGLKKQKAKTVAIAVMAGMLLTSRFGMGKTAMAAGQNDETKGSLAGGEKAKILTVGTGQIGLTGTLGRIEAQGKGFVLNATSFEVSNGRSKQFDQVKQKKISLQPHTVIFINGERQFRVNWKAMAAEKVQIRVIGSESVAKEGGRTALLAKVIVVNTPRKNAVAGQNSPQPDKVENATGEEEESPSNEAVLPPLEGLAGPDDIKIKDYSDHPVAADGYAIPASLKSKLNIVAFKDMKLDPEREYARFEKLVPFKVGPENKNPGVRSDVANRRKFLGVMFNLAPNASNRRMYDPSGNYDRASIYFNSITIWNETDNKAVTGKIVIDEHAGNVGLVVRAETWAEFAGKLVTIRLGITVSTLSAKKIAEELAKNKSAVEADRSLAALPVGATGERPAFIPPGSFFSNRIISDIDPTRGPLYDPEFMPLAERLRLIKRSSAWDGVGSTTKALTIVEELGVLINYADHPGDSIISDVIKSKASECGSDARAVIAIALKSGIPYKSVTAYTNVGAVDEDLPDPHQAAELLCDAGPFVVDLTKVNTALRGTALVQQILKASLKQTSFRFLQSGGKQISFNLNGKTTVPNGLETMATYLHSDTRNRIVMGSLQADWAKSAKIPIE